MDIKNKSQFIEYFSKGFKNSNQLNSIFIYLVLLSVILEILHIIIPDRSFEFSDLFGNLIGVFVVIFINNLINKYGCFKK